ncbi:unnamed protein product [Heligmosomoides polygyrus]|uniref:Rna-directed dna polymerase from mobile element jockey-like n=1 Tax=Heligmosomoides polygyrus TaxID=6339 RepID=A0A183FDP0_HELPZ|nr:unnamed protein product [Heligmosomoides polygyrus]
MKMEVDSSPFAATTISALATLISNTVGYTNVVVAGWRNDPVVSTNFSIKLQNRFRLIEEFDNCTEAEEQWNITKEATHACAEENIGRRRGTRKEQWIRHETWDLLDERKRTKQQKDRSNLSDAVKSEYCRKYAELDRLVKRTCRADKMNWLTQKGVETQNAAELGDSKTLYRIVKEQTGTHSSSNTPIKERGGKLLVTGEEQIERWVAHFKEVLNQPEPSDTYDFRDEEEESVLEVYMGDITMQETDRSIKSLKGGKAPGLDEISAELLKAGGRAMTTTLTRIFNICWQRLEVPEDWKRGVIVKIPKKGDLSERGNWRGVTLLSIPGKVFCLILLN